MSAAQTVINPWGAVLHLATDPKSYARLARRFDLDEDPGGTGATYLQVDTEDSFRAHFIVWIEPKPSQPDHMAQTAVHESVHVAAMLLDHVGSKLHGESETLAYLAGWLVHWMMAHLPQEDS